MNTGTVCLWAEKENVNFADLRHEGTRWKKEKEGWASQTPLLWRENGILRMSSNIENLVFPSNPQASPPAPAVAEVASTAVAQAKQEWSCGHDAISADLWSELPSSAA